VPQIVAWFCKPTTPELVPLVPGLPAQPPEVYDATDEL
jgi:hypothetical protein